MLIEFLILHSNTLYIYEKNKNVAGFTVLLSLFEPNILENYYKCQ